MLAVEHMRSRLLKLLQTENRMRLDMKLCSRSTKQVIRVSHIKNQIILNQNLCCGRENGTKMLRRSEVTQLRH